jgi:hypothetical protein
MYPTFYYLQGTRLHLCLVQRGINTALIEALRVREQLDKQRARSRVAKAL